MREIKFRAWDGIRMTTSGIMFNTSNGCLEVPKSLSFNPTSKDIDIYKLMQYTGLKDKNGKEIYEGDVCIYIGTNMSSMLIKFEDGCFVGEGAFNTHPLKTYIDALDFDCIEVIGNIYENPELL